MKIVEVHSKRFGVYKAFKNESAKGAFKNKMTEAYAVELLPSDIVVDIGAYIGEYTMHAATTAKKVIAYEPTLATFDLLRQNCNKFKNVILNQVAVVGTSEKTVELAYSEDSVGVTNSIVKKKGKSHAVMVKAINYQAAVKGCTVVKIDCEGAEYQFDIVQPSLRAIILEFHPVGKDWINRAKQIMQSIRKAGFKTLAAPKFQHGWDMHGAWVKK